MPKYNENYIEQLFNRVSNNYDLLNIIISLGMCIQWNKKTLNIINENIPSNGSFLDVGCGTGLFITKLKKKRNDIKLVGIDNSLEMIKKAKTRDSLISFNKVSVTSLPFKNAKFDTLLTSYTIRNFPNLDKSISEMTRVVKSNGIIVYVDLFKPYNIFLQILHYIFTNIIMIFLIRFFSKKEDYKYLSESIQKQIEEEKLIKMTEKYNCKLIKKEYMFFGIVRFFVFKKNKI